MQTGPTVEEPCPALKGEYDKVYYDETTGVRMDAQLARDATQEEPKFTRELKVHRELSEDCAKTNNLKATCICEIYTTRATLRDQSYGRA